MKTALPLIALLVILAGGIVWKTQFAGSAQGESIPAPELGNPNFGLVTLGVDKSKIDSATADEIQVQVASGTAAGIPIHASKTQTSKPSPEWSASDSEGIALSTGSNRTTPTATAVMPAPKAIAQYWSVESGQTLYRIAKSAYGKASLEVIEAIAQANQLDDPGAIRLGQKLLLPVIPGANAPIGN